VCEDMMHLALLCIFGCRNISAFLYSQNLKKTKSLLNKATSKKNSINASWQEAVKKKAERIATRRTALYKEHEERKDMDTPYRGDGLLLDNKEVPLKPRIVEYAESLGKLCRKCCEDSTGNDMESSGQGRYSWGTWVDEDLYLNVRTALEDVRLAVTSGICERLQGKDIIMGSNEQYSLTLRFLKGNSKAQFQFPSGSHVLLRPLQGSVKVQKLRKSQGTYVDLGDARLLRGAISSASDDLDNVYRLLGGPPFLLITPPKEACILEVVLRPPTGNEGTMNNQGIFLNDALASNLIQGDEVFARQGNEALVEADSRRAEVRSGLARATAKSLASNVGGLESQLDSIVRRVLASRGDPAAAKKLGIDHVKGILLSGPPGTGKTLLARELARELGAREPQIVNGPEILDKFVGEAERRVRELFAPAEAEYKAVGDNSALHVIILDEMDAIARKRGSLSGDTTGVRDGVVNTLLAKMDGVNKLPNILVIGLTNRPELIDDALLRPGRLEVKVRIERPNRDGRRQILRIHTRAALENKAIAPDAIDYINDTSDHGLAANTEDFSGAELAGLVRAAASFALGRATPNAEVAMTRQDFDHALIELKAQSTTDLDALLPRFSPYGTDCIPSHQRVKQYIKNFLSASNVFPESTPRSLLLVNDYNGCGATSLAAHAAFEAKCSQYIDFADFIDASRLIESSEGLQAIFEDATRDRGNTTSLLVFDDIDLLLESGINFAALKSHLHKPTADLRLRVIAVSSAPSPILRSIFDVALIVPAVTQPSDALPLLEAVLNSGDEDFRRYLPQLADIALARGPIGCKRILGLAQHLMLLTESSSSSSSDNSGDTMLEQARDYMSFDF